MEIEKINTGAHLPAYAFLDQFVSGRRVLDVYPSDTRGSKLLQSSANHIVSLVPEIGHLQTEEDDKTQLACGLPHQLPFASGSFDVVFFFATHQEARLNRIADFLKSARVLVGQVGVVCVAIPNRDARGIEGNADGDLPRYFDFERTLRRQFPHVTLIRMTPLHGATLCAIGRGTEEIAPLLDDRLIPEGTETPTHFIGVCSLRYQRMDDSMIIQSPYDNLAVPVRERIERLRSNMSIAIGESEIRARELEKLEANVEKMKDEVVAADLVRHEKNSVEGLLRDAERQLETRNRVQLEFSRTNEELTRRIAELEQRAFDAEHRARKEEQGRIEADNQILITRREIEENEQEREEIIATLRAAKAQTKARQRELDDVREELAGTEADISTLKQELERQRRETFSARDRATKLEFELKDIEEHRSEVASIEAELNRVRTVAATDRERLEQRLKAEHERLLEEMAIRAETEKRALILQKEMELAKVKEIEANQKVEIIQERFQHATERLETHQRDHRGARKARDEIEQLARDRGNELERCKHQMEILSTRATQAEQRTADLTKQVQELHSGLDSTEAELSELKRFKKNAIESSKNREALVSQLTADLNEAKGENRNLQESLNKLEADLADASARQVEFERAEELQNKLQRQAKENTQLVEELESVKSTLVYEQERIGAESKRAGEMELRERKATDRIVELEDELDLSQDQLAQINEEFDKMKTELAEMGRHVVQLERDLARAERERSHADNVTERLLQEKESELLKVSADVETELRSAAARLENAQGEIWELNEEIVRLSAQAAAAEAADVHVDDKKISKLEERISKQETIIENLKRERDTIRASYDRLHRAVKKKKQEKKAADAKKRKS